MNETDRNLIKMYCRIFYRMDFHEIQMEIEVWLHEDTKEVKKFSYYLFGSGWEMDKNFMEFSMITMILLGEE